MKDSVGNEFEVGVKFRSNQSPSSVKAAIKCVAITGDVAKMQWSHDGECFNIDQKNLLSSCWIKSEQ